MKRKLVGILVCMLLIAAAVLPVAGTVNIVKSSVEEQELVGLVDNINSEMLMQTTNEDSERGEDYDWEISGNNVITGHGGSYPSGKVGIGIDIDDYPLAKLHVTNGGVLFSGDTGGTPTSGSGRRLMWIPEKSAFRAGYVSSNYWDDDMIGNYSMGMGYNTHAGGDYSTAMGSSCAHGDGSTAMGHGTIADGDYSTAMGGGTEARGDYSTAIGSGTWAYGKYSTAMGKGSWAYGNYSTAIGSSEAFGKYATAMGYSSADGDYSTAMGYYTDADGDYSTAIGYRTKAREDTSTAMGYYSDASGNYSTAMGYYTDASGNVSTAMGYSSEASGICSTAMGLATTASGHTSTAMGFVTTASGDYSTAIGRTIKVIGINSVGIGLNYNDEPFTVSNDNVLSIMGGNVGIGTTSPTAKMHIVQTSTTDDPLLIEDTEGTDLFSIDEEGNTDIEGYVYTDAGKLYIGHTANILASPYTDGDFEVYAGDDGGFDFVADGDFRLRTQLSNDAIYADNSGKVGIGTTSPTEDLDVAGTAQMTGFKMSTGATDGYVLTSDGSGVGTWKESTGGGIGGSGYTNYIPKFTDYTTLGNSVIYDNGGNVGIGTISPGEKLEVDGNVKASSFLGDGSNLTGVVTIETDPIFSASPASGILAQDINNWNIAFGWGDHATQGYDTSDDSWIGIGDIYTMSGNVGIGTPSPSYLLHVLGGSGIVAQFSGRVKGAQAVNDDEFVTKAQVKSVVTSQYTPADSSDTNGDVGDTAWDTNYFYVKTPDGWKRASLETWETPEIVTN